MSDFLWVEQYRPQTIDECILPTDIKETLGDHYAAISDYSKAIQLDPDYYSYAGRAYSKGEIGDHKGSIIDYTKAIEINPKEGYGFYNRGIMYDLSGNFGEACNDWIKASKLGHKNAEKRADRCENTANFKNNVKDLLSAQDF